MTVLEEIEPKQVWNEFSEICKIPHGSGNVDALRAFLRKRAEGYGLKCTEDEAGNLLIVKEATAGFEKAPVICMQAHLDMVCSKRSDCIHDFLKDPIQCRIVEKEGKKILMATGTTLGADDGMGMAVALAILFDKEMKCGKLEALFTNDEETTMAGVHDMKNDLLTCKYLLNLDSEDIGVVTIGSAGGFCGKVTIPKFETIKGVAGEFHCHTVKIGNCRGGHSGGDIHEYRANAIQCLARLLYLAV